MNGGIFLIGDGDQLVRMDEAEYDAEERLQSLLEDYPDLLAGDQISPEDPKRWLLVRREAGVPGEEGGYGRWSLDHVFLDQHAVPTLVEVKRSTDTRIRREVVGQMLGYAANGLDHWPIEFLMGQLRETCASRGLDVDAVLADLLGEDGDTDAFWEMVRENLATGRLRLLFVADSIPDELRRVIEFLNAQMDRTEVLGIEVKQYVAPDGLTTLVPRVIGQTEQARQRKTAGSSQRRRLTREAFFARLADECSPEEAQVVQEILMWALDHGFQERYGAQSLVLDFRRDGNNYHPVVVNVFGAVELRTHYLPRGDAFKDAGALDALVEQFAALPEADVPEDGSSQPSVAAHALMNAATRISFQQILEWVVRHVEEFHAKGRAAGPNQL